MRQRAAVTVLFLLLFVPALRAEDAPPDLVAAVRTYAEQVGSTEPPRFRHALADLDGDGREDVLVLLLGGEWCGSGGCTLLVFRGGTAGFTFVSGSTVTGEPIRLSTEKRAGWKTLIVHSKGRGDVLMRFNGTRYPSNPSTQPKATPAQVRAARGVME